MPMRRHVHHYTGCSDDARSHTFFNGLINGVTHAIVIGRDDNSLVHKTQPFHLESKFLIQGMRIERLESSEPTTVPINQKALTLAWVERVLPTRAEVSRMSARPRQCREIRAVRR
jgi:hypothetical protein